MVPQYTSEPVSYPSPYTPEYTEATTRRYATLIATANEGGYGYLFDPDLNERLNTHFDALRKISGGFSLTPGSAFDLVEDLTGRNGYAILDP